MKRKIADFCAVMSFVLLLISALILLKPNNYMEYKYPNSEAIIVNDISVFERGIDNAQYLDTKLFEVEKANFKLVFKNIKTNEEDYIVYFKEGDGIEYLIYNTKNNKYGYIEDSTLLRDNLHYEMDKYLNSIG